MFARRVLFALSLGLCACSGLNDREVKSGKFEITGRDDADAGFEVRDKEAVRACPGGDESMSAQAQLEIGPR